MKGTAARERWGFSLDDVVREGSPGGDLSRDPDEVREKSNQGLEEEPSSRPRARVGALQEGLLVLEGWQGSQGGGVEHARADGRMQGQSAPQT